MYDLHYHTGTITCGNRYPNCTTTRLQSSAEIVSTGSSKMGVKYLARHNSIAYHLHVAHGNSRGGFDFHHVNIDQK